MSMADGVDGVADVAIVVVGVVMVHVVIELLSYYFFKNLVLKKEKRKKRKHQPCPCMAGVIVDGVADVATIIVIGVVVACLASELFSI